MPIYLDYNATTPVDPAVAQAMLPFLLEHHGNPSSRHGYGTAAKAGVDKGRAQVAALLGCRPSEIVFTSGGSESDNMAVLGAAHSAPAGRRHIVTTAVEHPAILETCRALEGEGFELTVVGVDRFGRVDPGEVERAVTPRTILISVMHANNEVGTIQPIAEIAAVARRHDVLLHTDAAQSIGKIPADVGALGVDFLTVAGHKLYAPKGIGALYVRSGRTLPKLIHGAGHESGRRAGTENVLGIVGLGMACELAAERLEASMAHGRLVRDRLWGILSGAIPDLRRNGDPVRCLPNTLSVGFRNIDAGALLSSIGGEVAASPGAACHSAGVDISSVLRAMDVPLEYAMGTVRFSTGRGTTTEEIDRAAEIVIRAVKSLS
jgi:cysteine desulfurase